jgi:hypothetical protein
MRALTVEELEFVSGGTFSIFDSIDEFQPVNLPDTIIVPGYRVKKHPRSPLGYVIECNGECNDSGINREQVVCELLKDRSEYLEGEALERGAGAAVFGGAALIPNPVTSPILAVGASVSGAIALRYAYEKAQNDRVIRKVCG